MNVRPILLFATALAGAGLLAGLGVLSFGSPDQVARIPSSGLLVAAVVTLAGTIYLRASKPRACAGQNSQSMLSTIGFAILVVIALFLVGFFVTNH
jgi:hypothetical protein